MRLPKIEFLSIKFSLAFICGCLTASMPAPHLLPKGFGTVFLSPSTASLARTKTDPSTEISIRNRIQIYCECAKNHLYPSFACNFSTPSCNWQSNLYFCPVNKFKKWFVATPLILMYLKCRKIINLILNANF